MKGSKLAAHSDSSGLRVTNHHQDRSCWICCDHFTPNPPGKSSSKLRIIHQQGTPRNQLLLMQLDLGDWEGSLQNDLNGPGQTSSARPLSPKFQVPRRFQEVPRCQEGQIRRTKNYHSNHISHTSWLTQGTPAGQIPNGPTVGHRRMFWADPSPLLLGSPGHPQVHSCLRQGYGKSS